MMVMMIEEMRGKKEQEGREEAEKEKVMGLDILWDGQWSWLGFYY